MKNILISITLFVLLIVSIFILTGCSIEKTNQDVNESKENEPQVHFQPIWIPSTNGRLQMVVIPHRY